MQTVYIGSNLVNDVMLGSQRMVDVFNVSPSIVTSSLALYFDASYSASAANWRATLPFTGSGTISTTTLQRTASLFQTDHTAIYPATFNLTGSQASIDFNGGVPLELTGSGPYTIQLFAKPVNDIGIVDLFWYGNALGGGGISTQIQISGSIGGTKFLRIETEVSNSVARDCVVSLNQYHQFTFTADGTENFNGLNVWVDSTKQAISGSASFVPLPSKNTGPYNAIGTNNGVRPLSGSVVSYLIYNRKLSDNEILQNLRYFNARVGIFN
jgi:hypothetical protein